MKKSPGPSMLSQANKPPNLERSFVNGSVNNGNLNLKEIMLHKGSKCKCLHKNENDDIFTKNEDDQFDEVSMGSSQDHSIDAQMRGPKKYAKPKKSEEMLCGSFCKKIGPKDQRKVILECLRIDMSNLEFSKITLQENTTNQRP